MSVITVLDRQEKYGRLLATIHRRGDAKSINERLLAAGLAFSWDGHGPAPVA